MKHLLFAFLLALALPAVAQDTIYPWYQVLGLDTFYQFKYDRSKVPYPVYSEVFTSRNCLDTVPVRNDSLCKIRGHVPSGGEPVCWSVCYVHEDTECCTLRYIQHGDEYHMCGRCMATFLFSEAYTDTVVMWHSKDCYYRCRK